MQLTNEEYLKAVRDNKFMAARYKRRVAISQIRLERKLASGNLTEAEKKEEIGMHKARIKKMKEYEAKAKADAR